ncbi:BglG family transcription antiterminator [Bacillus sp. FJAT-50079]|uniref:BglG family transcription antiterminator n=1 Tax=Bacillus sp. FJAT-50079 TaxID=2833577 RepID=UPI001BCA3851|nr:BglG family transcription antiterminator [Bacillus sp. FJAT-50079]MBS4207328.1 transcription antiterminator [Bacillus sp. FJAT-50079]
MSNMILSDRVVQIIEIARKKSYSSLDDLAEGLAVSTRSIRNYIKQLNNDLIGIVSLKNEKGKGYYLHVLDEPMLQSLLEINKSDELLDSPKRRMALIIDRLINSEEIYTLDDLAFEMHMSRTTLINELKKSSVSLKSYNLIIQGKQNKGMYLSGKELDLRFFLLDNIYDLLYDSYPIDPDIIEEIVKICIQHDLESTTQTRLLQFIIVMLDRLLKDHPLTEMDEKHKKLLDSKDYEIALEIVHAIESQLPIKIPQLEILFITMPIAGRRTPTNNRTMANIVITDDIKNLLESIVEQVGFNKEIIKENESFFTDLQYHLTFMINRLIFGLRLKNPLLADVKEKYPVAFKMAQIAGQVIENKYELEVTEDELGYLAFYFGVFITNNDVKVKRFQKAAIICGTGRGTAKLVAIQLERILNQDTEIHLYSEQEVTKELLAQYDIVFTTVTLPFEMSTPFIMISEIFNEKSVEREIEKISYMQTFKIQNGSTHHSILKNLVTKDKLFMLDSTNSYHGNVREMIDHLVRTGYLDAGFKERLKERENKGSMVFDHYIALPHTFNYQSSSIELAIGIFPESVIADGKEIKLVFLLGLPEQQSDNIEHLIVKIYDEIIRIANNKKLINVLVRAKGYDDVMKILEEGSRP